MSLTPKQTLQVTDLIIKYGTSTYTEGTYANATEQKRREQALVSQGFIDRIKDVLAALTEEDSTPTHETSPRSRELVGNLRATAKRVKELRALTDQLDEDRV